MNASVDVYWDGFDGDNLACSPGQVAPGYEFYCWCLGRLLPAFQAVVGVIFFKIAFLYYRINVRYSSSTITHASQIRPSLTPQQRRIPGIGQKKPRHNGMILALVLGSQCLVVSTAMFVSMHGTQYPTTHIRGTIGDYCAAVWFFLIGFMAHMQVQGALWFKGLVTLDGNDGENKPSKWSSICSRLPTASKIMDTIQGTVVGLIIWLGLCTLVTLGLLPRAWFITVGYAMNGITSGRSFAAIATQRVDALRKVAVLHNQIRGTAEDKKRRRGILKNKTLALVIDLTFVFVLSVASNASIVLLRSAFSSRQFLVHITFLFAAEDVLMLLFSVNMYNKALRAGRRKRASVAEQYRRGSTRSHTTSSRALFDKSPQASAGN
jgi:hypothetical protein